MGSHTFLQAKRRHAQDHNFFEMQQEHLNLQQFVDAARGAKEQIPAAVM